MTERTKDAISASRFFAAAAALLLLDRLTKLAVVMNIPWESGRPTYHFSGERDPIPVIDGFLYIVHITNEGAAWGMLSGRTWLLGSIAVVALFALWVFRNDLGFDSKTGQIALGIFAGGVAGNLLDRIFYGHVIDFIDVHLPLIDYRWPAFNIADCGICVGVAMYAIMAVLSDGAKREKKSSSREKGKTYD